MSSVLTSLRVPANLLDRADALAASIIPSVGESSEVKRSTVLRIALSLGLQRLERKHAAPPKRGKRQAKEGP